MDQDLKRTPLYSRHIELGGKMVPFAGWEMPVQYSGLMQEHNNVRQKAGIFDVCHMGEIALRGPQAEAALQYMTCNDLSKLSAGHAQYNAIINPSGGVVDDIIVYKKGEHDFFICVNASNTAKDFEWFTSHNKFDAAFENLSAQYGQIALQGPSAIAIFDSLFQAPVAASLSSFSFCECSLDGMPLIVARTGYTGEDGVEVFVPVDDTAKLWDLCLAKGQAFGLLPCGLGARDTLRLEACYPLHGHELGDDITAIESGLAWIVKPEKGDFIGRNVLAEQKENGSPRVLAGFFVDDPGIVREHTELFDESGKAIGSVTSGTRTPTLEKSLGMALVNREHGNIGRKIYADVRGRRLECHVVAKPFYKRNKF